MSNKREIINTAIGDCLTRGPLDNWNYEIKLKSKYADDMQDIVLSILGFISDLQPDWQSESLDAFLQRCKQSITKEFPFLNDASICVLVNRIAYDWK